MLEVNQSQYISSMKKFKIFAMNNKQRSQTQENVKQNTNNKNKARSLKQVWQVLKLNNILQDDEERLPL